MTAANKQNKGYCAKCGTPPRNAKFKSSDYKGFEIPEAVKGTDLVSFFLQNQSNNRICSTCQNSLNETIKIRGIDVNGRMLPQARLCQPLPPPELTAPVDDRKEPIFLDTPLGFKHTIRIDAIIDDFISRVTAPSPQNNTTTATAADQVHIERSIGESIPKIKEASWHERSKNKICSAQRDAATEHLKGKPTVSIPPPRNRKQVTTANGEDENDIDEQQLEDDVEHLIDSTCSFGDEEIQTTSQSTPKPKRKPRVAKAGTSSRPVTKKRKALPIVSKSSDSDDHINSSPPPKKRKSVKPALDSEDEPLVFTPASMKRKASMLDSDDELITTSMKKSKASP